MQRIVQAPPPPRLTTLRNQNATFDEVKADGILRWVLFEQQRGRCAYCERPLRRPDHIEHKTKIEHFHPQNSDHWNEACQQESGASDDFKAPTTWSNLLLCCDGNESVTLAKTCDTSKSNTDICSEFRNPRAWHSILLVHISRDGRALPDPALPDGAIGIVNNVLNLNEKELVAARRQIGLALKNEILAKSGRKPYGLSPSKRANIIARLRERGLSQPYGSTYLSVAELL
ncbi:hypothetical protein GCM10022256_18030 [Frondihabitans peucedani]|uniref:TIGR02646 family protein n=1 Tax=Frondihabitans peucedani TaxID=598626 RepID=A0ABP8E1U2_9MICO